MNADELSRRIVVRHREAGYLRVYREEEEAPSPRKVEDAEEEEPTSRRLPPLREGQVLRLDELTASELPDPSDPQQAPP